MDEALTLPQSFIDEMIKHAREDNPSECCGLIGRFPDGSLKLYRASNVYRTVDALLSRGGEMDIRFRGRDSEPVTGETSRYRFSIPGHELIHLYRAIEGEGGDMLVIYHSHTMTEARPSPTDLGIAARLLGSDPWPYWVLVSLAEEPPPVRAWRIESTGIDGAVKPTEIDLRPGPEPPGSGRVRLRPDVKEVPLVD